jgi:hypothetical protein
MSLAAGRHPHHATDAAPSATTRLRVWRHRGRLDRVIADGAVPTPDHALRALQLGDRRARRRVARSLRSLVAAADLPSAGRLAPAVPICRRHVVPWREGLLGLADRLDGPEPVNPCGTARALMLITDGAGPLYNPAPDRPLPEMIWWIADGLTDPACD